MRLNNHLLEHSVDALRQVLRHDGPADGALSRYFREHPKLGHRERGVVAELIYTVLRRRRSLEAMAAAPDGRTPTPLCLLLTALVRVQGANFREIEPLVPAGERDWLKGVKGVPFADLPAAVQADLPDWLHTRLSEQLGDDLAAWVAAVNRPAPLDLRVNPLNTTREAALAALAESGIAAAPTPYSPIGIRLGDKPALAKHPLFVAGAVEVQDEGSQLLCYLVAPKRGEMVADFCAGAGGKTLLLGGLMRSQGRLYAFDVSDKRLAKMKPRLARSGLSNVHPVRLEHERDAKVRRLAGKLDRVLVDAPCSGLGTLRRNPDLKWRQSADGVAEMAAKQRDILAAAATLVKPGGRLVYATCSALDAENHAIVDAFLAGHPDFAEADAAAVLAAQGIELAAACRGGRLQLQPHRHGTDGFFAAVLTRRA